MTRFIIFRHGQTDWNLEHRIQGSNDIPLNKTGKEQAKKLAQRLQHEIIDVIYSSPLQRAIETAKTVAFYHEKDAIILDDLFEMHFGELEGKIKSVRNQLYPWFDVANDEHRKKLKMDTFAETIANLQKKTIPELVKKHPNQTVALSTHDQKMRSLMAAFGMSESVKSELMKSCAVSIIAVANGKNEIICHNDSKHMGEQV